MEKWFRTQTFLANRSAVAVKALNRPVPLFNTLVRIPCLRAARSSTSPGSDQHRTSFVLDRIEDFQETTLPSRR